MTRFVHERPLNAPRCSQIMRTDLSDRQPVSVCYMNLHSSSPAELAARLTNTAPLKRRRGVCTISRRECVWATRIRAKARAIFGRPRRSLYNYS
ncbi:hypothetical protein SRHO_G00145120 [Serrasalmus rhombeus]